MKKTFFIFACFLTVFCLGFLLVGCGSPNNKVLDNLSDVRYGVFDGKNEDFCATFIYGEREYNYKPDGKHQTPSVNFGIISVVFPKRLDVNQFEYTLTHGNKVYSGTLEKSPFKDEYLTDIGEQITDSSPLSLTFTIDEKEYNLVLERKNENWKIDYKTALKIGEEALKEEIKACSNEKIEFYLKIISDNKIDFGNYFWQFSFISESGSKHSVTISTNNEQILVKN